MAIFYDLITDDLREWALKQQIFYTASAPLVGRHVNISPKGLPSATFTIFDGNHAAYVDTTGSGSETISHVYENGRVTIMFCSFGASPRIMRFFCHGRVVEWDQPEFKPLLKRMGKENVPGARAIILLDVWKAQTSCGFGVPRLSSQSSSNNTELTDGSTIELDDRDTMFKWTSHQIAKNQLRSYQAENNAYSLDGLPGLKAGRRDRKEVLMVGDIQAWVRRIAAQKGGFLVGVWVGMIILLLLQGTGLVPAQRAIAPSQIKIWA